MKVIRSILATTGLLYAGYVLIASVKDVRRYISSTDSREWIMRAIESMLKLEADTDGWRTGSYDGKTLWLTPNEVGGLTLMRPEDW